MISLEHPKIKELLRLAGELDKQTLNKPDELYKEVRGIIKVIAEFVKKSQETNEKELENIKKTYKEAERTLIDTSGELSVRKEKQILKIVKNFRDSLSKEIRNSITRIDDRVSSLQDGHTPVKGIDYEDGKDADPKEVSEMVVKELMPILEKKIEKELEKIIEYTGKRKQSVVISGNTARNLFKEVDISDSLDGSTKTFNIGAFYMILSVDLSSYPYGALIKNTHYTTDSNAGTITFTDEIAASTQLSSGQKAVITMVLA